MVVLALVILVLAGLFVAGVVVSSRDASTLEVFRADVDTTVAGVFISGLATGLIVLVAVVLLMAATRRARHQRREVKALKKRAKATSEIAEERDQLAEEKARLQQELEMREAARTGTAPPPDAPPAPRPEGPATQTMPRGSAAQSDRSRDEGPTRA